MLHAALRDGNDFIGDSWARTALPIGISGDVHALAYRIQELTYGGLSAQAENHLNALLSEAKGKKTKRRVAPAKMPVVGTRLVREWKGERYEVIIMENGFEYAGRKWNSLTAIAREITGTHWNGPVFFGLRRERENNSLTMEATA